MAQRAYSRTIWLVVALVTLLVPPPAATEARQGHNSAATNDWPMPHYDFGRTRANLLELTLYPQLGSTPAQELTYSAGQPMVPAAMVATDMLFWYDYDSWDVGGDLLVATDLAGQRLWSFEAPASYNLTSLAPVVAGEEVFVLEKGYDEAFETVRNVVALDRASGAFLWRRPTHYDDSASGGAGEYLPIAVQDGVAYLTWETDSGYEGYITAVNARTGAEIWSTLVDNVGGRTANALAITQDILLGLHHSVLAAYDLSGTGELWLVDTRAGLSLVTESDDMLAVDGKVAVANNGRISVYAAQTGEELWRDDHDGTICEHDRQMVMASDGQLLAVMGVCGDQLVTYDLATGIEAWRVTAHRASELFNIVIANGVVYVNAYDDVNFTDYISAYDLQSGDVLERIDTLTQSQFAGVLALGAANGQLYATIRAHFGYPLTNMLWVWGGDTVNAYLPAFNDDGFPDTNPDNTAEVSIIRRDGSYGAEVSVGARIGSLPATLNVYDSSNQLVKQAIGNPDAHGNGFWVVPLEHAAGGYEYQVILADATEMPRRSVVMPADPAAAVDFVVQTESLIWQAPPATISSAPYTLTLALPGDFPGGATTSYAVFQRPGIGMLTIAGQRVGGEIRIRLDEDSAINGDFIVTVVALAGNVTAFSADIDLGVDAPTLPDVRMGNITAFAPHRDGSATASTFFFERDRPAVDPSQQADAQIASVVPDPSGFQVTLWVQTPPENPLNPLTSTWEVGISGRDAAGNELDRVTTEIPAAPDGRYVVMSLTQRGTEPIATISALGATLEGAARSYTLFSNTALLSGCEPPGSPKDGGKPLRLSDLVSVNISLGVAGEAGAGPGAAAAAYVQGNVVNGQVQACSEAGPRYGVTAQLGGQIGLGASLDLRGADHVAPASSGRKYDVTVAAGVGVQLSYTVPDNFGDSGYGQVGVSISAAPEVGVSGGVMDFTCWPPQSEKLPESRCCTGPNCGPDAPNPPPPPGGDHPDDTLSVVLQNTTFVDDQAYWRNVVATANAQGFGELVAYARYRLRDLAYLAQIQAYPTWQPLTPAQQKVVRAYESNRLLTTAEMLAQRGTIAAQIDLLEALQANVLANGYYAEMRQMLSSYGIPNRLVSPDFSPDALSGSMLVIPTAGLYGLEGDTAFSERLARFVDQGGTLLVMTQPGNEALDLLPGDWQQVDYHEDISCYRDAMTLRQYHPILASVAQPQLTAFVDGFTTAFPAGASLLLERTKNQEGAFVLVEYGQGRMLVTNMYDDWGRTVGQSSAEVRNLFRDVVRWASLGGATLPEAEPGQPLTVDVEVRNVISEATAQLQWVVREPNSLVAESGLPIRSLSLDPGENAPQTVSFTPGSAALGIWSLSYQLLDVGGEVLQGETVAGYFIVSDPPVAAIASLAAGRSAPAAPSAPLAAVATEAEVILALDKAAYVPGANVQATLDITLSDPGAISGLRVTISLGESTVEQLSAALSNQQVVLNLPADFSSSGLLFYGVYEATTGQGLYLNTRWVQPAGDGITVLPAAPSYQPGESVTLNISGDHYGRLFIEGNGFARTLDVAGESALAFDLPAVMTSGPVKVHYDDGGFRRTARFDIIGPRVTVTDMQTDLPVIVPGAGAVIVASVVSDRALDVLVTGQVVDGDGFVFPVISSQQALIAGAQTLTMTVPISATTSGSVRFEMTLADAVQTAVRYVKAHRYLTIDAPVLQAIRVEGGQLSADEAPVVQLDWYSTSGRAVDVTVWLDGAPVASETANLAAGFSTSTVALPDNLAPGSYALYGQADAGNGLTTSASSILIMVASRSVEPKSYTVYLPLALR